MIIACERCKTQFKLDPARIGEAGTMVRCSRCKHAFVVKPSEPAPEPEPDPESADDAFDWQFDNQGLTPTQAEAVRTRIEAEPAQAAAGPADGDDLALASETAESLLELEPDGPAPADAFDLEPPARAPADAPPADGVDELGSPADWDIFDEPAPVAPRPVVVPQRAERPAQPHARRADDLPLADDAVAAAWLRRSGAAAGWLATAALGAFVALQGLAPRAPAVGAAPLAPGLAVEGLSAHWVENARLGALFVVRGDLRNQTSAPLPMPELELVWRDAASRPVGEAVAAGGPRPPVQLREAGRDELARAIPMLLGLGAGEARRFEVVAWSPPRDAQRFEIRVR